MLIESPPTFLIIGAAGDGKSSIIKALITSGTEGEAVPHERLPETGRKAEGVTKVIKPYRLSNQMVMTDTMGIGDMDKGISHLIAGVRAVSEGAAVTEGYQLDGVIVTSLIATGRLGISCLLVQKIIEHGLVKNSEGISPWERIIICGTKRDKCDEDEIEFFKEKIGPQFFKNKVRSRDWQVTTSSSVQEDGMHDLLHCMQQIGRGQMCWDPNFDKNGGAQNMAVGVCSVTNGSADLTQLQLEKEFAWSEVIRTEFNRDITGLTGKGVSSVATCGCGLKASGDIVSSVGKDFIERYASQNAAGVGSGVLKGSGVLLQEGSEQAVGQAMCNVANEAGKATLKSRTGDIIVDVGARNVLAQGAKIGSSMTVGAVGMAAEFIAGRFDASKDHKKAIGFAAQITTATGYGLAAGGPPGAMVSAGAAVLCWVSSEVLGTAVEKAWNDSKGETNPAVIKYMEAKEKYDNALEKKKSE